jgi:hypothetical protein
MLYLILGWTVRNVPSESKKKSIPGYTSHEGTMEEFARQIQAMQGGGQR